MAQMLQKQVFALPGCQRMSVNNLLCDTLGLAAQSAWFYLVTLTLQSLFFFARKSKDAPKKARTSLSAETLKILGKKGKAYKKARKTTKRKKQGNESSKDWGSGYRLRENRVFFRKMPLSSQARCEVLQFIRSTDIWHALPPQNSPFYTCI